MDDDILHRAQNQFRAWFEYRLGQMDLDLTDLAAMPADEVRAELRRLGADDKALVDWVLAQIDRGDGEGVPQDT